MLMFLNWLVRRIYLQYRDKTHSGCRCYTEKKIPWHSYQDGRRRQALIASEHTHQKTVLQVSPSNLGEPLLEELSQQRLQSTSGDGSSDSQRRRLVISWNKSLSAEFCLSLHSSVSLLDMISQLFWWTFAETEQVFLARSTLLRGTHPSWAACIIWVRLQLSGCGLKEIRQR